jgi:ankyrin repeat protein
MIEYCLESIHCDPDIEIKSTNIIKNSDEEQSDEENDTAEDEEEEENISNKKSQQINGIPDVDNEESDVILKETSIFSLLRTVPFIDSTVKHPLEIFLEKTKDVNVLHHKTQRTPLLESIYLRQSQTALILINDSSCDINLSTSTLPDERQQTPLILACKLQLLSVIHSLLEHKQCDLSIYDYENNQAIHYYLQTSNRSNEYVDAFKIFIKKLQFISNNQGKYQRTPLHTAVYHNLSAIDATNDVEQVLIDNKSDLLLKDNLGNIPLHNVFLNKKVGDDPVELCVLIIKAMGHKSLDTKNNEGDTPLHLAVVSFCVRMENKSFLISILRLNVLPYV